MLTRRHFLRSTLSALALPLFRADTPQIMTVTGPISAAQLGQTLIHEHILVDFIGADKTGPHRWNRAAVVAKMLPKLQAVKALGMDTLVECTPSFLGKDPLVLRELSEKTGLRILTNTGYYGAVDNKYLPSHAFTETADQLAARWIAEYERGIDGTGIRPGFMKISVNPGTLSDVHRKLITAAARCHRQTGLTIYSHTGPHGPAFEQLAVLKQEGVRPEAFVWVHAQNTVNTMVHYARAARQGAWVSLDGLDATSVEQYATQLSLLKENGLLNRVLLSHDAGWYDPDQPDAPLARDYTVLFTRLMPLLNQRGFTKRDWEQLLRKNPAEALTIRKRLL